MAEALSYFSLYSGVGGADLALQHLLGWRCKGYCDLDPFARGILRRRIEEGWLQRAPLFEDAHDLPDLPSPRADLLIGGFPCQPWSKIGARRQHEDERNEWPTLKRLLAAWRPRGFFLENVPHLLRADYFGTILRDLAEGGQDAVWAVLAASGARAPHRRQRLWLLSYPQRDGLEGLQRARTASRAALRTHGGEPGDLWSDEPGVGRLAHGVPHRVDRLRALGNAIVPVHAALAFLALADLALGVDAAQRCGDPLR